MKKRHYTAAMDLARYADFLVSHGSADAELRQSLAKIRAKARFLTRNSSSMRRFVRLMQVNVVGPHGMRFQSQVKRLVDGKADVQLNSRVEKAWSRWSRAPTACGTMNLVGLMKQAVHSWCTDGEVFWEIVENSRYPDRIAIHPLEADMIDETMTEYNGTTGNEIRMGVEVDDAERPVAYWVLTAHPGDYLTHFNARERHRRVPAERIIHIYEKQRPGQSRGEPPGSSIINALKMLDGYREAEVVKRRIGAAAVGFITSTREGGSPTIPELADKPEPEEPNAPLEIEAIPGKFFELPPNKNIEAWDVGKGSTDYAQFELQMKRDISMGFNLSAFSHGQETQGVSYSTGRSVLIEDRDYYRTMQLFFIDQGLMKFFPRWLANHALMEESDIPPTRLEAIRSRAVFRGRGWEWVDPAKEVRANAEALGSGQTSFSSLLAARGLDRDEVFDELQSDLQALKERGIPILFGGAPLGDNENDEEE